MDFRELQIKKTLLLGNIKYKTELINDLYDARESLTFDKDLVQSSHGDTMICLVAKIDDLKTGLEIDKKELENINNLFLELQKEFKKIGDRNMQIYLDYYSGISVVKLSLKYYLTEPAIYKIIKKVNNKLKEYKKV